MNHDIAPAPSPAHELHHVHREWLWLLLLGVLMSVAGTAAIVVPAATTGTTFAAVVFLGVLLMVSGVAMIISAFWMGKWSGFLIHLLAGILYVASGVMMTENPLITAVVITIFVALSFIVLGAFRIVGALVIRPPQWGWSVLSGVITLLMGVVVYRQLPYAALWVIGLLVGLELLFNGLTWIMLAVALRRLSRMTA